jgi:hypothetical protein
MKTVYEPANAVEAHMLANLLRQGGFSPFIQGEHLSGGMGELPAMGLLRLNVPEDEHLAARRLLDEWEAEQGSAPLPDGDAGPAPAPRLALWLVLGLGLAVGFVVGVAVGAAAVYGWQRAPGETAAPQQPPPAVPLAGRVWHLVPPWPLQPV